MNTDVLTKSEKSAVADVIRDALGREGVLSESTIVRLESALSKLERDAR